MARNIVGLWGIQQTNGAFVNIDIDGVNSDGTFKLEANHNNGAVTGTGTGVVHRDEVHFTITWSDGTQGAYIGAFDAAGFLNGSTFDIKNPATHAGWRSKNAF